MGRRHGEGQRAAETVSHDVYRPVDPEDVEQPGQVVHEMPDRVPSGRLVGLAVASQVVGEHVDPGGADGAARVR